MATINPTIDDPNRDWSLFRIGQTFSYENARFINDRDPYGRLVTRDLPEEALGAGVDIVDPDTREPLKNNMEIWGILEQDWEELIRAFEIQRWARWSILGIFERDNPKAVIADGTIKAPFMIAVEPKDTEKTSFYNDHSLKGTKLRKWTKEDSTTQGQEWFFVGDVKTDKDEKAAPIENAFFVSPTYKRKFWEGRSEVEGIWDEIWGLRAIHMGCTIFAIRKGSGLKLIIMPEDASKEDIALMKAAGRSLDSIDGYFLLPPGADVKVDAMGQADYNSLKDCLITALSAKLKIPKARLEGIEPGNLQGAKVNEEAMFDVWRRIQRLARPIVKWMVERYNSVYNWIPEDIDWDIEFRVRESIDEELEANILSTNVTAYIEAINADLISVTNAQIELEFPEEAVDNPKPLIGTIQMSNQPGEDDDEQDPNEDSDQSTERST